MGQGVVRGVVDRTTAAPKVVSERLGYPSVAVTLGVYQALMPGTQAAAAEQFGVRCAWACQTLPCQAASAEVLLSECVPGHDSCSRFRGFGLSVGSR